MKYVPLYIKTDNSLQQSLIKIDELIKRAIKYNITALTITDNNMYGVMDFYKLCKKNNIKPIVGLEVSYNKNIIVLYCINYEGYKNLIKLSTIMSYKEIEINELEKYSDNLICIVPFNSVSIFNDVRGFLFTSPLYNSPNSYSQYINQNKNNETFQHLINNKPKYNVKTMQDLYNKYFEDDKFTLKSWI